MTPNSDGEPLTETELTEYLDHRDALDASRAPGCYALRLRDPSDDTTQIRQRWETEYVAEPPKGFVRRLADADRFAYVGSHAQSVYRRLCQHCAGHQSSTIMAVWPPVDVMAIWPESAPTDMEWGHANELADDNTVVWTDGSYL